MTDDRLHYLDNLRVFAMLFGILVHTCTITDFGRLQLVQPISHNFRMGMFFAVSGFFGALLLARYPAGRFLRERLTALLIPLLSCLALLNPVTLWLVYRLHNDPAPFSGIPWIVAQSFDEANQLSGAIVWHLHLWFLISLAFYCLSAPLVLPLLTRMGGSRFLSEVLRIVPQQLHALLAALAVAALVIFFRAFFSFALRPLGTPWIVVATLQYWPFYILGLGLFGLPSLWNRLHKIDVPLIGAAAALWLVTATAGPGSGLVHEAVMVLRRSLTICAVLFALLWLFRTFLDRRSAFSAMLSGSIYTIYLFHYIVIYAIASILAPLPENGSVPLFLLVAGLTFAITFSLHHMLIARSPMLLFLFNGRTARRRLPAAAETAIRQQ